MSTDTNNAVQDALKEIEQKYLDALQYIEKYGEDESQVAKDKASASYWKKHETYTVHDGHGSGNWYYTTTRHVVDHSAVQKYKELKAEIAALEKDAGEQLAKVEALGPGFQELSQTMQTLMNVINGMYQKGDEKLGITQNDMANISKLISKVVNAMIQQVYVDMYSEELQVGGLSESQINAIVGKIMQYQSAELNDLNEMDSMILDMVTSYRKDYDDAKVDKNSYNIMQEWFTDASEKESKDGKIMDNADHMIKGLLNVMGKISVIEAGLMPELTMAMNVITDTLKEIKKILNDPKLTDAAKKKEILSLVMFLLTFFQVIKQDIENNKAKNNQEMSKGNIQSSQMNIEDTVTNEKIKEEVERNAKINKIVMVVSQVILGAVLTVMAPGVGTALVAAMVTALEVMQTEGVFNLTGALGKVMGSQIGADIFVAGLEMIATMGGGAALDRMMASYAKGAIESATKSAMESAEDAIQSAAQKTAALVGNAGDETSTIDAAETLRTVAEKAAQKAAQGAFEQFMKQPLASLVKIGFGKALENAMGKAADEAAQTAIQGAATIAKLAARGVESSEDIMNEIATRSANEAVASASSKSLANVTKDAELSSRPWKTAAIRGLYSFGFGLANANFFVDLVKQSKAKDNQDLLEILQVLQGLTQMLMLMFGSGMLSGATFEGNSLSRLASVLTVAPQSMQAAGSYGNYLTYSEEAKAVKALSMDGSVADLLHSFIEQLQKDQNLLRDIFIKDQQQEAQSTASLAAHVNDGDQANINVLISAV